MRLLVTFSLATFTLGLLFFIGQHPTRNVVDSPITPVREKALPSPNLAGPTVQTGSTTKMQEKTLAQPTPCSQCNGVKYADEELGFSFQTPANFEVLQITPANMGSFSPRCRNIGLCVLYPDRFPETTFAGAALSVGIVPEYRPGAISRNNCYAFDSLGGLRDRGTTTLGGVLYVTARRDSAAAGIGTSELMNRAWLRGKCYAVTLSISEVTAFDPDRAKLSTEQESTILDELKAITATLLFDAK